MRVLFILLSCLIQRISSQDDASLYVTESDDQRSASSRKMASLASKTTTPSDPVISRVSYPEKDPHICLAFLSCCDRTDLLNHTLAGVIRHMEEDEPSFLRYEIAWVDNGSDEEGTDDIANKYQIEKALRLPINGGLAYGMNLLIHNLCSAPYILLLEEDWLYLDDIAAPQTPERKRVVATSIALIENMQKNNVTAYDGRTVMGVFLRHETYDSFMRFPLADTWNTRQDVDIKEEVESLVKLPESCEPHDSLKADIDYRIFCSDPSLQLQILWGSYTNGAGLYRRADLIDIGRMYGEPGDPYPNRYTESNYSYRAGIKKCHSAIRLTDDSTCNSIEDPACTGAFHHIGGGRGTAPTNAKDTPCADFSWNLFGTPMYRKYMKYEEIVSGVPTKPCSREELKVLQDANYHDTGSEEYRRKVKEENKKVFEEEQRERDELRDNGNTLLSYVEMGMTNFIRNKIPDLAGLSDDEIRTTAERMVRIADSPHPLAGYWDSHGRILKNGK